MIPFANVSLTYRDAPLLVSGERDSDDCFITRVTAADSAIDLFDMLPLDIVTDIAERVDAQLSRETKQANAEARRDRALHQREMDTYAF